MIENWRDIPGFEGRYQVSDLGRVRSLDHRVRSGRGARLVRGRVLRPGAGNSGHLTVVIGKGNTQSVHVLVLRTFVGEPPAGCEALHLNHTPADNRLKNLRWGTRGENLKMDYAAGLYRAKPKVTLETVATIRALRAQGFAQRDIAARVGLAQSQIQRVLSGRHRLAVQSSTT